MWSRIFLFIGVFSAALAHAQNASQGAAKIDNDFVHQQFGDTCNLEAGWPPLSGDLNGDGIPDLAFVARCKNPLVDQDEKNFLVIDPMDSFYGYGNTSITSSMGQLDPRLKGLCILVIHGAGPDAWHSAKPGPKFVIINLAVKNFALRRMHVTKKKTATAIYVEEASGDEMTSAIFWDGKKYRYAPLGSAME
jgi:hypothetical protein